MNKNQTTVKKLLKIVGEIDQDFSEEINNLINKTKENLEDLEKQNHSSNKNNKTKQDEGNQHDDMQTLSGIGKTIDGLIHQLRELKDIEQTAEKSFAEKNNLIDGLNKKVVKLESSLARAMVHEKIKNEIIEKLGHKLSEFNNLENTLRSEITEKCELIEKHTIELTQLRQSKNKLKEYEEKHIEISSLLDEKDKIVRQREDDFKTQATEIEQQQNKIDKLERSLKDFESAIEAKNSRISEIELYTSGLEQKLHDQNDPKHNIRISEIEQELKILTEKNEQLEKLINEKESEINNVKQKFDDTTDYIKQLENIKRKKTILGQDQGREIAELKKIISEHQNSENLKNEIVKELQEKISELELKLENSKRTSNISRDSDDLRQEKASVEYSESQIENIAKTNTPASSTKEKKKLNLLHFPSPDDDRTTFKKVKYGDLAIIKINLMRATLDSVSDFKNYMNKILIEGEKKLIIDLSRTEFIDSTFLGVMVHNLKKLSPSGGDVRLVLTSDTSLGILHVTRMDRIFKIFRDLESAITSYSQEENSNLASG